MAYRIWRCASITTIEVKRMKFRSDDEYREQIFNEWFKKNTKVYELMRDGKCCDIGVDIIYPPFISTFNKAYRTNMRHYDTVADCYGDCMALVWEGMIKFRITTGSTWKAMAEKEDTITYRKLVSFLKTHVIKRIKELNEDYAETSKWIHKGNSKKMLHIYYNITPESLNQITTFDNSLEQVELVDTVTTSYWEQNLNYRYDIFMEWAKENMRNYLTESQKKFLDTLQAANYSSFDKDYDKEALGDCYAKLKLERIRDKVSAKYCADRKYFTGGYVVQSIDAELKSFSKFINVLCDEKEEELDGSLTRVILNAMNSPYWERLIYDDLSLEAQQDIIWTYKDEAVIYEDTFKLYKQSDNICRKTLYEVANAISARIDLLLKLRENELALLEQQAGEKNLKVKQMQYVLPENYTTIFLNVNANGIMVQK